MSRRREVLRLLEPDATARRVPAAFFIHFDPAFHRGRAAVDRHLEFFEHTGMDIVKVQYEDRFPHRREIRAPADWARLPVYDLGFYDNQLEILSGIIAAVKDDALVIQTVYSPFMQASTTVGNRDVLKAHIERDAGAVNEGMARITESTLGFVRACIDLGVDGFYASTQGGETGMLAGSPLFERCVRPHDLAVMRTMERACRFNVLHICDFHAPYSDLDAFTDYPGHVVSAPGSVESSGAGWVERAARLERPLMGGLDRHGVIASGSDDAIAEAVRRVLEVAPRRFMLGADCTLPADVSWDRIRTAIAVAHAGG